MKRLTGFISFINCLILLAPFFVQAGYTEPLAKRIVLDNGMLLLLSEKHDIPIVAVNMIFPAGSRAVSEDKPGLEAITASLLTQGTSTRSANQISSELDFIGASLSVSAGGDFASAHLRVLKKDVSAGMELLSDVLLHPVFDQQEIDRAVKATLAEIKRQKELPGIVADEAFSRSIFGKHPYGRTGDDVATYLRTITRKDIRSFYEKQYLLRDAVIAVVGDITEVEIVELMNQYFKQKTLQNSPEKKPILPVVPDKLLVKKINKDVAQAHIVMGHLGIQRSNPDYYAVQVMNYILGAGGFSSRLMDNIRDNRGLAYDVRSSFAGLKDPGSFKITIQTKNESANEVIREALSEINSIRTKPVTDKELRDAKAYLTGSFPLRMDTSAKIAALLGQIEFYNLGLDFPAMYSSKINAVTKKDILRAAQHYLYPEAMTIVVVANQEKAKVHFEEPKR
ncbi:MAG: pitrilysin family protein [Nitrospirota bacterium]